MRSRLPKVLHPLAGKPMLEHVLASLTEAGVEQQVIVVGHGAEEVEGALDGRATTVRQEPQKGTADAVRIGLEQLDPGTKQVVVAMGSYLGDTSRIVGQLTASNLEENQVTITHGRGIWCAAAGVALVLLSMVLAGRPATTGPTRAAAPPDGASPAESEPPVWSWRRPAASEDDGLPEAPFDLTVAPAKPFATSPENRDKPS